MAQAETTTLSAGDEARFQSWAKRNQITDVDHPDSHYDYRGYWKANGDTPIRFGVDHFPDTYKQHGHPTFSVESQYSRGPNDGGSWNGDTFVPAKLMPDKIIEIPNVGRIAFPDSMTPDQINAAAGKLYADKNPDHPPPDPKHSWVDTAVDWLPTAGGAVGGLIGSTAGPLGAVAGAALGGAAGQAIKGTVQTARTGQDAPTMGQAAQAIGWQAALQGGAEAAGGVIGNGMAMAAPRIMQSAVKPTLGVLKDMMQGATVPKVVQTLLDEGVNVTPKGLTKLNTLLSASQADVKASLDAAEAAGHQISPYRVASRLNDTAAQFANQVNPSNDLEAVSKAGQEFLDTRGGQMLSPTDAQALKQGTYTQVRKKYGQLGTADTEAQKALARGLKEELEQIAPGIDVQNARTEDLTTAAKAVGRRVAVTSNRDIGGLADLAVTSPLTFLTVLADRSPAVKSMLARGLYQSAGAASRVAPQLIRGAVAALASQQDQP